MEVIVIAFIVIIGLFILAGFVMNLMSPWRELPAQVVGRRQEIRGNRSDDYYVTFELNGGERKEFSVSGREYGMWLEGDTGTLRYKGTWLLGWERHSKRSRDAA